MKKLLIAFAILLAIIVIYFIALISVTPPKAFTEEEAATLTTHAFEFLDKQFHVGKTKPKIIDLLGLVQQSTTLSASEKYRDGKHQRIPLEVWSIDTDNNKQLKVTYRFDVREQKLWDISYEFNNKDLDGRDIVFNQLTENLKYFGAYFDEKINMWWVGDWSSQNYRVYFGPPMWGKVPSNNKKYKLWIGAY